MPGSVSQSLLINRELHPLSKMDLVRCSYKQHSDERVEASFITLTSRLKEMVSLNVIESNGKLQRKKSYPDLEQSRVHELCLPGRTGSSAAFMALQDRELIRHLGYCHFMIETRRRGRDSHCAQ